MSETTLAMTDKEMVEYKDPRADLSTMLAQPAPQPLRKEAVEFIPLRDWVLVRICERDEMSEAGLIWLPKTGQERPSEGVVLACGIGEIDQFGRMWPTQLNPGDHVVFGRYAGDEMVVRGETCRKMREKEIQGIIR